MVRGDSPAESDSIDSGGPRISRRGLLKGVSGLAAASALPLSGSEPAAAAPDFDSLEESVRLTPRPAATDVGGTASLGGTWDFTMTSDTGAPTAASAQRVVDESGAGTDGFAANGPEPVTGAPDDALDCASQSHVEIGRASSLDFTSPGFSLQITFKYSADSILVSKGNDQFGAGVYGGQLSFWTKGDGNWPTVEGGSLSTGTWYTATFVMDSSEMRIYVDGSQVASTSHSASSLPSVDSSPHIAYNSGDGSHGTPVVDEFRAFEVALSDSQVGDGTSAVPGRTVCWFPMDSVSGSTLTDESGAGNDGALVNSPAVVSGRADTAIQCASQGHVEIGSSDSLDFTAPGFSVQVTFQYTEDAILFSKGDDQYGAGVYGNQLSFWTEGDGGYPSVEGGSLSTGTWYTATFVVDSSELRIYVDGTQVGSTSHSASSLPSVPDAPHIAYNTGDGTHGNPVVDEFRAFDTVLSDSQIGEGTSAVPGSTVCWLRFAGVSGDGSDPFSNDRTESVPGQWAYDGYFVPETKSDWYPPSGEYGWYRRTFSVPEGWEQGQLKLRFGAVYSKAWVYLNGTQIATHVGGYTAFEVDIDDSVDLGGSNTLDVVVDQRSVADDFSWYNVTGGIVRDVELVSVPDVHLSDAFVKPSLQGLDGGDTAPDESGAGNDGVLVNSPAVVAGESGDAVDCSGDSYVEIGTTGSLDFVEPGFSFQITFQYAEDTILFSKGNDQYAAGVYGGELSFWTKGDGNWPTVSGGSLSTGTWYTATFVMDSSEMRVYVDGTQVGSTSHSVSTVPQIHSPPHLAYDSTDGTHGTPVVDEFRAFDEALSDGKVADGYASPPEHAACWLTFDSITAATSALVTVDAQVTNGADAAADGTMTVTVTDPGGSQVGSAQTSVSSLAAGDTTAVTAGVTVSSPQLWTPEDPALHRVDVSVEAGGVTETVTHSVGLREVAVDGDTMVLNGEPVQLRGVNWEEIDLPSDGHAIDASKTKADAQTLKEANVNYVRTAHHPVSEAFLDACDELGIVVEEEAPIMFAGGGRGDPDPAFVKRSVAEMITRDRSRTCVCLWSVANESSWYDVFGDAAELAVDMDPTRPVVFNVAEHWDGADWLTYYDLAVHHYPALRDDTTVDGYDDLGKPTAFDEFGHTYAYNDQELVTDPGLRYEWDRQFDTIWDDARDGPDVVAAALWAGGDHLEAYGEYLWGTLDRHGRTRPEYWGMKKTYAPVRVTNVNWASDGSSVDLTFENRYTYVDLSDRTVEFTSGSNSGTRSVSAPPQGGTVTESFDTPGDGISVTVSHPQGFAINEFEFSPSEPAANTPTTSTSETFTDTESAYELSTSTFTVSVDQSSGTTTVTDANGQTQVTGGPNLAISELQSETGRDYAQPLSHDVSGRTVTDVSLVESGSAVEVDLSYDVADGVVRLRPLEDGIELEYDFTLSTTLDIREYGLSIPVTADHTDLSWERDGHWSTYPSDHIGRTSGSAVAFPSGSQPANDGLVLDSSNAWRHDETARGSNDFRSTKRTVYTATLRDSDGVGVRIHSNADTHVRCAYRDTRVDLLALDESNAGASPSWMDRNQPLGLSPRYASGDTIAGSTTISIV